MVADWNGGVFILGFVLFFCFVFLSVFLRFLKMLALVMIITNNVGKNLSDA
jgi:hypothetical protein